MTARTFSALGFDPAPGSPAVLLAQARQAGLAARALAGAATAAARLDAGWQGRAAEAYRDRASALPPDLRHAASAHGTLARELAGYADDLASRQLRAEDLEHQAAALHRAVADSAAREPAGGAARVAGRPGPDGSTAEAAGATARAELETVLAEARRLHSEHRSAARLAAARIRAATDPPYREPGLLARARGAAARWIADHADVLTSISGVLRGMSAVLGTVSLVPGFQFLAPVAIAAGVLAVVVDGSVVAATGRGSWRSLACDAALSALPTGPAARTVRSVPGMSRALKAVNRAVPAGARGPVFRAVRNLPEGVTAGQLAAAAVRIRSGARGLSDDVVVQGSRAGHSARSASDIDVGLRVAPERYDELVRECFGDPANAVAKANAVERGRIFWRHAGLKDLRDGLQADLGRKVDLAIIKREGMFDGEPWLRVR